MERGLLQLRVLGSGCLQDESDGASITIGHLNSLRQTNSTRKVLQARISAERIKIGVSFENEHFKSAVAITLFQLLKSAVVIAKVTIHNRQTVVR